MTKAGPSGFHLVPILEQLEPRLLLDAAPYFSDAKVNGTSVAPGGSIDITLSIGQSFKFEVNVGNTGQASPAGYSNITFTFPQFNSASDKSLVWKDYADPGLTYQNYFGSEVSAPDGDSEWVMAESIDNNGWGGNSSEWNTLRVAIQPKQYGPFDIYYRAAISNQQSWLTGLSYAPEASMWVDSLGFAANRITVNIHRPGAQTRNVGSTYSTIAQAINSAVAGDTIAIPAGTYRTSETFPIVVDKELYIRGAGSGSTIIQGNSSNYVFKCYGSAGPTVIQGLTVTGGQQGFYFRDGFSGFILNCKASSNTLNGILCEGGSNPTIEGTTLSANVNCGLNLFASMATVRSSSIRNNATGIFAGTSSWLDVAASSIYDNTLTGISIQNSIGVVNRSMITGNGTGVLLWNSVASITNDVVAHNQLGNNHTGIYLKSGSTAYMYHDTIVYNGVDWGVDGNGVRSESSNPNIKNCIFWGNGWDLSGASATYSDVTGGGSGDGNISADPKLDSNYRLTTSLPLSPVINAGTAVGITVDLDGHRRPVGGATRPGGTMPDMGACELIQSTTLMDPMQFNRIPSVTSLEACFLPESPAEYFATESGLSVEVFIQILNSSGSHFDGSVYVNSWLSPSSNTTSPLNPERYAVHLDSGASVIVPVYLGGQENEAGLWKATINLQQGNVFGPILQQRQIEFQVVGNDTATFAGPTALGRIAYANEAKISTVITNDLYKAGLIILDAVINMYTLYEWGSGNQYGLSDCESGFLPDDVQVKQLMCQTAAFYPADRGSAGGVHTIHLDWADMRKYGDNYTVDMNYDRAVITLTAPETVVFTNVAGADFNYVESGKRYLVWVVNGVDKRIGPLGGVYSGGGWDVSFENPATAVDIQTSLSLLEGPLGTPVDSNANPAKPSDIPLIYNYTKWQSDPDNVYWYIIGENSQTIPVAGASSSNPDLRLSSLVMNSTSPSPFTTAGGSITLARTYQVSSQDVTPDFTIQYHLSVDQTWGGSDDIVLTPDESVNAVGGKTIGGHNASFTVNVGGIAANTYYILARIDNGNAVSESDETNNVTVGNQLIVNVVASVPDLSWNSLSATPSPMAPGGTLTVTRNYQVSGASVGIDFGNTYHLSVDQNWGGGDDIALTGTDSITSANDKTLGAHSAALSLTVPGNAAAGTYYLLGYLDSWYVVNESDDSNNSVVGNQVVVSTTPPSMELVLDSVTDQSGNVKTVFLRGDAARVTLKAKNTGPSSVDANWVFRVSPSTNHPATTYDSDPTPSNTNDQTIPNDGQWHAYYFNWTVPANAPLGSHDLLGWVCSATNWSAVLDDTQVGANTTTLGSAAWVSSVLTVTAVAPKPDLSWNSLSATPTPVVPGGTLTVTRNYQVSGTAVSGDFGNTYHLSPDASWGGGNDYVLTGSDSITSANDKTVGAHSSVLSLTVPTGIPDGTYYVLGYLDSWYVVDESDDANNSIAGNQVIVRNTSPGLELVLDSVTDQSGNAKTVFTPGDAARVTLKAMNTGPSSVDANWVFRVSPSTNRPATTYDSDPTPSNTNDQTIPNDGQWHTYAFNWTIPANAPLGSHDLLGWVCSATNWSAVLDDTQVGANTTTLGSAAWVSSVLTVTEPKPDLNWNSLSATTSPVAPGGTLTITRNYQVSGMAVAGDFGNTYHLSPDASWGGGNDIELTGSDSVTSADDKSVGAHNAVLSLTVPGNTTAGTYYVLGYLDSWYVVDESDDANNSIAGNQVVVQVLAPGDANADGKVDGSDLAVWQQNYDPLGVHQNTFAMGDWNSDGKIDGSDLALWQQNYNPLGIGAANVTEQMTAETTNVESNATIEEPALATPADAAVVTASEFGAAQMPTSDRQAPAVEPVQLQPAATSDAPAPRAAIVTITIPAAVDATLTAPAQIRPAAVESMPVDFVRVEAQVDEPDTTWTFDTSTAIVASAESASGEAVDVQEVHGTPESYRPAPRLQPSDQSAQDILDIAALDQPLGE